MKLIKTFKHTKNIAFCMLTALLFSLITLGLIGSTERVQVSDVAVVLGNKVYPDGALHPRLAARVDRALELWRAGIVRHILVSGGVDADGTDEAMFMKSYLVRKGVPADAVFVHSDGVNTHATVIYTARAVAEGRWNSVLVVSEFYHVPRCRFAFFLAGVRDVRWARAHYFEFGDLKRLLREAVALVRYFFHNYNLNDKPANMPGNPEGKVVFDLKTTCISMYRV